MSDTNSVSDWKYTLILTVINNSDINESYHLQIAIQDAHGITLLVQLLNTTESFEIQELVTGVFWNLSSSDTLKLPILKQALESLVKVLECFVSLTALGDHTVLETILESDIQSSIFLVAMLFLIVS